MTSGDWVQLVVALVLVVFAGLLAAAEAALSSISKARANRLCEEGRPGAARLRKIADDPPRYLNTALFVRTLLEISLDRARGQGRVHQRSPSTWEAGAITAGVDDRGLVHLLGRRAAHAGPPARRFGLAWPRPARWSC